jgi:hypothetical protein
MSKEIPTGVESLLKKDGNIFIETGLFKIFNGIADKSREMFVILNDEDSTLMLVTDFDYSQGKFTPEEIEKAKTHGVVTLKAILENDNIIVSGDVLPIDDEYKTKKFIYEKLGMEIECEESKQKRFSLISLFSS